MALAHFRITTGQLSMIWPVRRCVTRHRGRDRFDTHPFGEVRQVKSLG